MQGYPRANMVAAHGGAQLRAMSNQDETVVPRAVVKRSERSPSSLSSSSCDADFFAALARAEAEAAAKRVRPGVEQETPLRPPVALQDVVLDSAARHETVPDSVGLADMETPSLAAQHPMDNTQPREPPAPIAVVEPPPVVPTPLGLGAYGLPPSLVRAYAGKGVAELYTWQVECLQQPGVLEGRRHLVYAAPTSGGKTLVAEMLLLRRVLERPGSKAMFIVPLAALAEQKMQAFAELFEAAQLPLEAEGYFRDKGTRFLPDEHGGSGGGTDVAVCTFEKAHHLLNRMVERKCTDKLRTVVIDEAHMIGDGEGDRGALLEAIVSKLLYLGLAVQIVCMSATLPNLNVFAHWFGAAVYVTTVRPVRLVEHVVTLPRPLPGKGQGRQPAAPARHLTVHRIEQRADGTRAISDAPVRTVPVRAIDVNLNTESVLEMWPLVLEVLKQPKKAVLVFANSRDICEKIASYLAALVRADMHELENMFFDGDMAALRDEAAQELLHCEGDRAGPLRVAAEVGVTFHHAGLTSDERQAVEKYYSNGALRVLVATSSLAVGVNLPASRVIFYNLKMALDLLSVAKYQQMAGRAGRKGLDAEGDVYVLSKPTQADMRDTREIVTGQSLPMRSLMGAQRQAHVQQALRRKLSGKLLETQLAHKREEQKLLLMRLLTDVIGRGMVGSRAQLHAFKEKTLFWRETDAEPDEGERARLRDCVNGAFDDALAQLTKDKHFALRDDGAIQLFPRAIAASATWYTPATAEKLLNLVDDTSKRGMVLFNTSLHVAYLVVPLQHGMLVARPKGVTTKGLWKMCDSDEEKAVYNFVFHNVRGPPFLDDNHPDVQVRADRFYNALLLNSMLSKATPSPEMVATRFGVKDEHGDVWKPTCGEIQKLLVSCQESCGQLMTFCDLLGDTYRFVTGVVGAFLPLLEHGVSCELVPLMALPKMQRTRARLLYNAGIRTPEELMAAPLEALRKALFPPQAGGGRAGAKLALANKVEEGTVLALRKTTKKFLKRVAAAATSNADMVAQTKEDVKMAKEQSRAKKRRTEKVLEMAAELNGSRLEMRAPVSPPPTVGALDGTPAGSVTSHTGPIRVHDVSAQSNASDTWLQLCEQWARAPLFAWSAVLRDSALARVMVCFGPTDVWDVPVDACADATVAGERRQRLFAMLHDKPSACWDALPAFTALERMGLLRMVNSERVVDLQVYAWLCNPDRKLEDAAKLAKDLLDDLGAPAVSADDVRRDVALCCNGFRAAQRIIARLADDPAAYPSPALVQHEMLFVESVARMGARGIGFSVEAFGETRAKLQHKLDELAKRVCAARQVREFDVLNPRAVLQVFGCTKNAELERHSDPVARDVVRCRVIRDVVAQYDELRRCVDDAGRIRCVFATTASATGRLTTRTPNLQCVPHARAVPFTQPQRQSPEDARQSAIDSAMNAHTFDDEAALDRIGVMSELSVSLRDSFVSLAPATHVLLSADYTQLELRVIAHLSGDEALVALLRDGGDVFCKLGAVVHRKSTLDVTERERAHLKGVVYGMVYGMGPASLAARLGVTPKEADALMAGFRAAYPRVSEWKQAVVREGQLRGYVETVGGRRRFFGPPASGGEAAEQMRVMINTVCQGSAADLVKRAMVALQRRMGDDVGCTVLQIHDELLVSCARTHVAETTTLLRTCMEDAEMLCPGFRVPLPVRISAGVSWGQLSPL